jgi:hypothetical protein
MDFHRFHRQLQQHLTQLEAASADPESPLDGKVDPNKWRSKSKYRTPQNTPPSKPDDPRVVKMQKKFGTVDDLAKDRE